MMINLAGAGINTLGLNFENYQGSPESNMPNTRYGEDSVVDGELYCPESEKDTFACSIQEYTQKKTLREGGVEGSQVNAAENDFWRGLGMVTDVFAQAVYRPGKAYSSFFSGSCDQDSLDRTDYCEGEERMRNIEWMINIPIYFMYLLTIIQLLSGRNVETYK